MTAMTHSLPEAARVHGSTVTEFSEGKQHFPQDRKLRSVSEDSSSAIDARKVHPEVWAEALREARGHRGRIRINSTTNVTVTIP